MDETAIAFELEVHPAECQRKCDRRGQYTAPHDQEMRQPPREAAAKDKILCDEIFADGLGSSCCVLKNSFPVAKELPSASPIGPRRRPLKPHGVAKNDRAERDDTRDGVSEKGGIEMF